MQTTLGDRALHFAADDRRELVAEMTEEGVPVVDQAAILGVHRDTIRADRNAGNPASETPEPQVNDEPAAGNPAPSSDEDAEDVEDEAPLTDEECEALNADLTAFLKPEQTTRDGSDSRARPRPADKCRPPRHLPCRRRRSPNASLVRDRVSAPSWNDPGFSVRRFRRILTSAAPRLAALVLSSTVQVTFVT